MAGSWRSLGAGRWAVAVLLAAAVIMFSGCGGREVSPASQTDTCGVAEANRSTEWRRFRSRYPYHYQTLAISPAFPDGCQVLVIAEPPPGSADDLAAKAGLPLRITRERKRIGHDGYVEDLVTVLPPGMAAAAQAQALAVALYGTAHKMYLTRTGDDPPPATALDVRPTPAELAQWLLKEAPDVIPVGRSNTIPLRRVLDAALPGVFFTSRQGLVLWSIPKYRDLESQRAWARQFAVESDLILGSIESHNALVVVARERQLPPDAFPPLRFETMQVLAAVDTPELGQSFERGNFFAGRYDARRDWAPIYLSGPLVDTEYGSLLDIADQFLKSWSQAGATRYENFAYPDPPRWPFPGPASKVLGARELVFNWNTSGLGGFADLGDYRLYWLKQTGSLAVTYVPDGARSERAEDAAEHARDYFSSLDNPILARVVQYAALYQIFRDAGVTARAKLASWGLDSVTDPSGNSMHIGYDSFEGFSYPDDKEALAPQLCNELLPAYFTYTAGVSQQALRTVTITYEKPPFPEPSCQYIAGFGIGAQARIHKIVMSGPAATSAPQVLRAYTMNYKQSVATGRSLLQSVQECDSDQPSASCKAPTTFTYESGTPGFQELPQALTSLTSVPYTLQLPAITRFADLNNDGRDDVIFEGVNVPTQDSDPPPTVVQGYALSDGSKIGPMHILGNLYDPDDGTMIEPGSPFTVGPAEPGTGQEFSFLRPLSTSCRSYRWRGKSARICAPTADGAMAANNLNLANDSWVHRTLQWGIAAPYFLGDLDGNGAVDLVGMTPGASGSPGAAWAYWLNNNTEAGFSAVPGMTTPRKITNPSVSPSPAEKAIFEYMARIDSTGKVAMLSRHPGTPPTAEAATFVATWADAATGDTVAQETTLPAGADFVVTFPQSTCDPTISSPSTDPKTGCTPLMPVTENANTFRYIFIDLNGDGNDDALQVPTMGGPLLVSLNTGAGFGPFASLPGASTDPLYALPNMTSQSGQLPTPGVTKIADLNGDGLPDLLVANDDEDSVPDSGAPYGGPVVAYMSNGANGVSAVHLHDATNGSDILQGGSPTPLPSGYWDVLSPYWLKPPPFGVDVLDFNGDGRSDVYANGHIYIQQGNKPDLLTGVTDGFGKSTAVSWAVLGRDSSQLVGFAGTGGNTSPLYTPATDCQYPLQCLTKGLWVVSSFFESPDSGADGQPFGNKSWHAFQYAGGRSDLRGRGWLGFDQIWSFDYATMTMTATTYSPRGTDIGYGYAFAGLPQVQTVTGHEVSWNQGQFDYGMKRVQTTLSNYEVIPTLGGRGSIVRPKTLQTSTTESSQSWTLPISSATTTYGYDSNTAPFNLNSRTVSGARSGETYSWAATYAQNTTNGLWLLSLPTSTTETSTVPGQAPVTRTHLFNPSLLTGLLLDETVGGGQVELTSKTTYTRDQNGQVTAVLVTATDPLTSAPIVRSSQVTFDSFDGVFPSSAMDGLGHTTRMVYHPGLGVLAFSEDPNGVMVHATFDTFGRRVTLTPDGGGTTTTAYEFGRPYGSAAGTVQGLYTIETDVAGGGHSYVTYNSLGHEVVRGARNHDGTYSFVETTYSGIAPGQVASISKPHPYGAAKILTYFSYDLFGRLGATKLPDGNIISTTYVGTATTVTDPRGYATTRVTDDLGRVVRVDEDAQQWPTYSQVPYQRPPTAVSTNFIYGPFAVVNQVSVTARATQGGATTVLSTMTYDGLGRRTSLLDADAGYAVTTYDALGEMTSETDGNGDVHIPTHDALGRAIADYSSRDGSTYYQWDTAAHGIGKLAATTGAGAQPVTTSYAYDAYGRLITTAWTIPSQGTYALSNFYDDNGRLSGIGYPDSFSVGFGFDQAGALDSVTDGSGAVQWAATAWQADGRITGELYGSGSSGDGDSGVTSRVYDQQRGWLNSITTTDTSAAGTTAAIQNLGYHYDPSGNLQQRTDAIQGVTETFHNDFLSRLDKWTFTWGSANVTTTFGYDVFDLGNLSTRSTMQSGTATTHSYASGTRDAAGTPGAAGVHALMTADGQPYGYDAKGNQTSGPGRTVAYSSFSLPTSIATSAGTTTFRYDAHHQRVLKTEPTGATTVSIGGLYERRTDPTGKATDVFYIPGGGRLVAQVERPVNASGLPTMNVLYLHDDQLGSIESVTGETVTLRGALIGSFTTLPTQHNLYDPFGARLSAPPSDMRLGFTEQEHDDELGLINMRGRVYDPTVARFLSVDPMPLPSSQGLNGYSYVYNNPLNLIDPTGFYGGETIHHLPTCDILAGQVNNCELEATSSGYIQEADADGTVTIYCTQVDVGYYDNDGHLMSGPPPTEDSNGPGAFGGSTAEQLKFYYGPGASGAIYQNRATQTSKWNPNAQTRAGAALFGANDTSAFFEENLESHTPIGQWRALYRNPNATADQFGLTLAGTVFMLVPVAGELGAFGEGFAEAAAAGATCAGGVCPCFVAGTRVDTESGGEPIEVTALGDRVGPTLEACAAPELAQWREVDLQMTVENEGIPDELEIRLLRPDGWILEHGADVGRVIDVALDDLNVAGQALVTRLGTSGHVHPGNRCPVTGWVRHTSHDVIALALEEHETLRVTRHHRLFSAERGDWVHASDLHAGEALQSKGGIVRVVSVGAESLAPMEVFNLEVLGAHRYFVGAHQVLAHNVYGDVEEAAAGIYEFSASSGKTYVGQSGDVASRLEQHLATGKLLEEDLASVETMEVPGGKLAREIAEQQRINQLGGVENLENVRNPIGPARQHVMPETPDVMTDEQ